MPPLYMDEPKQEGEELLPTPEEITENVNPEGVEASLPSEEVEETEEGLDAPVDAPEEGGVAVPA